MLGGGGGVPWFEITSGEFPISQRSKVADDTPVAVLRDVRVSRKQHGQE